MLSFCKMGNFLQSINQSIHFNSTDQLDTGWYFIKGLTKKDTTSN